MYLPVNFKTAIVYYYQELYDKPLSLKILHFHIPTVTFCVGYHTLSQTYAMIGMISLQITVVVDRNPGSYTHDKSIILLEGTGPIPPCRIYKAGMV